MSSNGIKTSFWGPPAWRFLFSTIMGSFPVKVDPTNKDHKRIISSFHKMFKSMIDTLPCIYCRQSYKAFIKQIPITQFSDSRKNMMKWLYLIRDCVNRKLIEQERDCYENEKLSLLKKNISSHKLKSILKDIKSTTMITKSSPPFEQVFSFYEKQRAGCSKTTKKCS